MGDDDTRYLFLTDMLRMMNACFCFFFIPFVVLALLSRSLTVIIPIRGHIAGPPPASPLRYVPSFLSREEISIFFPRRLASNCAYPRQQLIFVFAFPQINTKSHHGGNRTQETTLRYEVLLVAFEGSH